MNKKEALKVAGELNQVCYDVLTEIKPNIFHLIDDIYEDFKNRTCENCKWYQDKCCTNRSFYTSNRTSVYIQVDEDFGCNKFETRTKDGNML